MRQPQPNQLPTPIKIGSVTTLGGGEPAAATIVAGDDGLYRLNLALPRGLNGDSGLDWDKGFYFGWQKRSDNSDTGHFPTSWINGYVSGSKYTVPEDGMVRIHCLADQGTLTNSGLDFFRGPNGDVWAANLHIQKSIWGIAWIPVNKNDKFNIRIWSSVAQTVKFYEALAYFLPFKKSAS